VYFAAVLCILLQVEKRRVSIYPSIIDHEAMSLRSADVRRCDAVSLTSPEALDTGLQAVSSDSAQLRADITSSSSSTVRLTYSRQQSHH